MSREAMARTRVIAAGLWVPPAVVTNHDLSRTLDTSDEWIRTRTGVVERRRADAQTGAAEMGAHAARQALDAAGVAADEVDVLIVSTATPDRLLPSTACEVQALIGASRAAAFDIASACSGYVYGLQLADALVAADPAKTVLLVCAERMSSIVDWTDRSTCVLFGDGATAALIRKTEDSRRGLLAVYTRSDGRLADVLQRPAGGGRTPLDADGMARGDNFVKMDGKAVFKAAVSAMTEAGRAVLDQAGMTAADVDAFIPHQANLRIIEATARQLGVPDSKVITNLDHFGNMSSASVPAALYEAMEAGRLGEGAVVLMTAAGAGMTWGGALVRL